jgi:hypothetical protein
VTRAGGIPAGLWYQELADEAGLVLHGLVAVHLDSRRHCQEPRDNRARIDAQFRLDREQLAPDFPSGGGSGSTRRACAVLAGRGYGPAW